MTGHWADTHTTLPPDWDTRRQAVRQRAGDRCEARPRGHRCPNTGSQCDHRTPRHLGGTHDLTNLQWLCTTCHTAKTQHEAAQARRAIAAQRWRPREDHPGITRKGRR